MNLSLSSILRIVGITLIVIAMAMIPSLIVSFIYDDSAIYIPFLMTMLAACAAGFLLVKSCHRETLNLKIRDGFLIVSLCWFISAALGAVPFVVTDSIPHFADAFFESCSGFTTTGATVLAKPELLPKGILFWRSFTHWIGGMGILIFAIALMPSLGISGQNIAVSEAPGPSLDKITPKMSDTAKSLYTIYLLFTIAETIMLMAGGMSLYDSLITTFGSVGTGGLSNYSDSMGHFDSTYLRMVVTGFMFLCGVNFNLYYLSAKHGIKVLLKDSEFRVYFLIFAISSLFIFAMLMISGQYESSGSALSDSVFQVSSILTTTGFITADYETWPIVCQVVLLFLMFVGGCSSSTGGGLKVIRIMVLFKLIKRGISTRLHPNVVESVKLDGENITNDTASAIVSHAFLYVIIVFVGAFIISFENADLITCFSSVITCIGNVGPGLGAVGPVDNFGVLSDLSLYTLSVYMLAGRLELYTLFIVLTPRFWNPNR
ncbi:MAG: TrkH family potassium uptake protein [Anaerovoracaceae bacterium]|nr:TrkH family potassium uptake protein [Anaerovoracaceae bacterium]